MSLNRIVLNSTQIRKLLAYLIFIFIIMEYFYVINFTYNKSNKVSLNNTKVEKVPPEALLSMWMEKREYVYEKRRKIKERVCEKLIKEKAYHPYTRDKDHYYWSSSLKAIGCVINKVASTSIMIALLSAEGVDTRKIEAPIYYKGYLQKYNSQNFGEIMRSHYQFIFVRNPMDRLASCFLEKLVVTKTKFLIDLRFQVKKVGASQIFKRNVTRGQLTYKTVFEKDGTPIVSFEEFLEYILKSDSTGIGFSSHWVTYNDECSPCHHNFSLIGKLETGFDDLNFLWKKIGLDAKAPLTWRNKVHNYDERDYLYKQIPRYLLVEVYQRFKLDFLIFDYDFNDLLTRIGYERLKKHEL